MQDDTITNYSETPDLRALQYEYQTAWDNDGDSLSRIARSEDVRYQRWPGQSADGLKHQELMPEGKRALPYDRAPDTRINLADGIIQELVDRDYVAFWGARAKTAPTSASRLTATQASEWRSIISWMLHGPLQAGLIDDVEFASQVLHTVGWVVLHPCWRREQVLRKKKLSLDSIVQLSQQAPPASLLDSLPRLIMDPDLEDAAVEFFQAFFPDLKQPQARRVIHELRDQGEATFATPGQVYNCPELTVLVPWQDFIMPIEATADPRKARAMFRRKFVNDPELEELAREGEWSQKFVDEAKKTKGQAIEEGTNPAHYVDINNQLMEVVWGYSRTTDQDGVVGLTCTVFSPHVTGDCYGKHELVDLVHGQFPFIILTREVIGRRPADARGVPDNVFTQQQEMKQQRDATYVYSQLSITPPLQKRGTQASKLPPELGPLAIINTATTQDWTWFPPPVGNPQIAFNLLEQVRKEVEDYYGVPRPDLPPARFQPKQQRQAQRWLCKWGQALWQLSVLAYQFMDPDELQMVLGHPPSLNADLVARHHLLLWFDVRALDPEWVETLLQNITNLVLPADSAGVVDRGKLVQFAMAYLDPTLADEVTSDAEGAKQAVFKQTRDEIGQIMQGNEGLYTQNDPTAPAKLQFANQVLTSNPDYIAQLHPQSPAFAPRKAKLMENWMKNLQQNVAQQQNKTVGRLGVQPMTNSNPGTY